MISARGAKWLEAAADDAHIHDRCWERCQADAHAVAVLVGFWLAADMHDARDLADATSDRWFADAHNSMAEGFGADAPDARLLRLPSKTFPG